MIWTPEHDRIVADNRGVISSTAIAELLGTTKRAVLGRIHRLKLPKLDKPLTGGHPFWTPEFDKIIIDNRGLVSSTRIAEMIGGVTRNAVLGRINRLKLPKIGHARSGRPKGKRINGERKERKAPTREYLSPPIPVEPLNIMFIDLEPFHCREIVGSLGYGQSLSCGHPVIEGSSYCRWHHSINHTCAAPSSRPYFRVAA